MIQRELKMFLKEASNPSCTLQRQTEIGCLLTAAVAESDEQNDFEGREDGLVGLLGQIYYSTLQNRPELLPTLFPVFAIICGDREKGSIIADVDWTLTEQK